MDRSNNSRGASASVSGQSVRSSATTTAAVPREVFSASRSTASNTSSRSLKSLDWVGFGGRPVRPESHNHLNNNHHPSSHHNGSSSNPEQRSLIEHGKLLIRAILQDKRESFTKSAISRALQRYATQQVEMEKLKKMLNNPRRDVSSNNHQAASSALALQQQKGPSLADQGIGASVQQEKVAQLEAELQRQAERHRTAIDIKEAQLKIRTQERDQKAQRVQELTTRLAETRASVLPSGSPSDHHSAEATIERLQERVRVAERECRLRDDRIEHMHQLVEKQTLTLREQEDRIFRLQQRAEGGSSSRRKLDSAGGPSTSSQARLKELKRKLEKYEGKRRSSSSVAGSMDGHSILSTSTAGASLRNPYNRSSDAASIRTAESNQTTSREAVQLATRLREANEALKKAQNKNDKLQRKLQRAKESSAMVESEVASLTDEFESSVEEQQQQSSGHHHLYGREHRNDTQLRQSLQESQAKIASLKKHLADLENNLDDDACRIRELEETVERSETKVVEIRESFAAANANAVEVNRKSQRRIEELEEQVQEMEADQEAMERELQTKLVSAEQEVQRLSALLQKQQSNNSSSNEAPATNGHGSVDPDKLRVLLKVAENALESTRAQLRDSEQEVEALTESLARSEDQLAEAHRDADMVPALEEDVNVLRHSLQQAQDKLTRTLQELESSQSHAAALEASVSQIQATAKEQLEQAESSRAQLQAQLESLQGDDSAQADKVVALTAALSAAQLALTQAQQQASSRIEELEAQVKALESSSQEYAERLKESNERLHANHADSTLELERAMAQQEENERALKDKIADLEAQLQTTHSNSVAAESDTQEEIARLTQSLAMAKQELADVERASAQKIGELEQEIESLRLSEEVLRGSGIESQDRIAQLEESLEAALADIEQAEHKYVSMVGEVGTKISSLEEDRRRLEEIEQELEESRENLLDLKQELASAEQRAQLAEEKAVQAAESTAESEKQLERVREAEKSVRLGQDENQRLVAQMEELENKLTQSRSAVQDLEEERNFARAKLAELSIMMKNKEKSDADTLLHDKTVEFAAVSAERDTLQRKYQASEALAQSLKDENSRKSAMLSEMTKNSASSSASDEAMVLMERELDRSLIRATDLSVQLAESQMKVEELRQQIRVMNRVAKEEETAAAAAPRRRFSLTLLGGSDASGSKHGSSQHGSVVDNHSRHSVRSASASGGSTHGLPLSDRSSSPKRRASLSAFLSRTDQDCNDPPNNAKDNASSKEKDCSTSSDLDNAESVIRRLSQKIAVLEDQNNAYAASLMSMKAEFGKLENEKAAARSPVKSPSDTASRCGTEEPKKQRV